MGNDGGLGIIKEMKRQSGHRVWWTGLGDQINIENKAKERDSLFSELGNDTIF